MFCIDFSTFYRAGLPLQGKGYQFGGLNSSDQSFVPLALFSAVEKTWSGKLVGERAPFEKQTLYWNNHALRMFVLGQLPAPVIGCCWWWRQGCGNDWWWRLKKMISMIVATTIITSLWSRSWSVLYCEMLFVLCVFFVNIFCFEYLHYRRQSDDQPSDMFNHHETDTWKTKKRASLPCGSEVPF